MIFIFQFTGLLVLAVASLLQFVIEFRMHGINHHNPFQIAIVHDRSPIWFVGTMLGSFVSGPNAYTWPARKCYVSPKVLCLFFLINSNIL